MDTRYWNKRTLYQRVDLLRQWIGVLASAFPINSVELAYIYTKNLTLEQIPFPSNKICGILYKGDNSTSIGLNANRTPEMQNFDCMHELIHYFFHDICYCQCICSDEQSGEYIQQDRIQEWQANEGAAQFLVPYQDFIPRFSVLLAFNASGIQNTLAEYYHVTEPVINFRLSSLAYEIEQFRNGVPIERIELLSQTQRKSRGLQAANYRAMCDFAASL